MSATRSTDRPSPPRIALTLDEACQALGVSQDFMRDHIWHELKIIRRGSRKLVPVAELERWCTENAAKVFD